jgi:hypothetical protein
MVGFKDTGKRKRFETEIVKFVRNKKKHKEEKAEYDGRRIQGQGERTQGKDNIDNPGDKYAHAHKKNHTVLFCSPKKINKEPRHAD